jgi:hypothetical protein
MVNASSAATSQQARFLYQVFFQFYDDWVTHPSEDDQAIFITARTYRVLREVCGRDVIEQSVARWAAEGSIEALGSPDGLRAKQPCLRIRDYVSAPVTPTI